MVSKKLELEIEVVPARLHVSGGCIMTQKLNTARSANSTKTKSLAFAENFTPRGKGLLLGRLRIQLLDLALLGSLGLLDPQDLQILPRESSLGQAHRHTAMSRTIPVKENGSVTKSGNESRERGNEIEIERSENVNLRIVNANGPGIIGSLMLILNGVSAREIQSALNRIASKLIVQVTILQRFYRHGTYILRFSISDHFSPSLGPGLTPKLPPPPSSTSSAPGGPGLPPPPSQSTTHAPYPAAGPSSSAVPAQTEQAPTHAGIMVPHNASNPGSNSSGGFPDDLDPHNVPAELKKEGSDWFAIFNPKVKRVLDVSLVHTLMHERWQNSPIIAVCSADITVMSQRCVLRSVFCRWQVLGYRLQSHRPDL